MIAAEGRLFGFRTLMTCVSGESQSMIITMAYVVLNEHFEGDNIFICITIMQICSK